MNIIPTLVILLMIANVQTQDNNIGSGEVVGSEDVERDVSLLGKPTNKHLASTGHNIESNQQLMAVGGLSGNSEILPRYPRAEYPNNLYYKLRGYWRNNPVPPYERHDSNEVLPKPPEYEPHDSNEVLPRPPEYQQHDSTDKIVQTKTAAHKPGPVKAADGGVTVTVTPVGDEVKDNDTEESVEGDIGNLQDIIDLWINEDSNNDLISSGNPLVNDVVKLAMQTRLFVSQGSIDLYSDRSQLCTYLQKTNKDLADTLTSIDSLWKEMTKLVWKMVDYFKLPTTTEEEQERDVIYNNMANKVRLSFQCSNAIIAAFQELEYEELGSLMDLIFGQHLAIFLKNYKNLAYVDNKCNAMTKSPASCKYSRYIIAMKGLEDPPAEQSKQPESKL